MRNKLLLFAGPCVLESRDLLQTVADVLSELQSTYQDKVEIYFKGSFDKANRTSFHSYRGPGLDEGLKMLQEVRQKWKLKLITDFHLPEQAESIAEVVDVLQVPAFLCRQTDMIFAGASAAKKHNRILKIKKGQFLSPYDTEQIVLKAKHFLTPEQILLTERGTSFGYNHLVVDMTSFSIMKSFGVKAIHDATHCVQRPGSLGGATGGMRSQIDGLTKAAIASGCDGIFFETHPQPTKALSDAATSLPLCEIKNLVKQWVELYQFVGEKLSPQQIDD